MQCPADGCEYESPNEKSVKGHWGGSQDERHTGAYHKALEQQAQAQAGSGDSGADSPGSLPDVDSGASEASNSDESDGDMVELPCGCESFDESKIEQYPVLITCDTCGAQFRRVNE